MVLTLEDVLDILFWIWMSSTLASIMVYGIVSMHSIAGAIFIGFLLLITIIALLLSIKEVASGKRRSIEDRYRLHHLVLLLLASIWFTIVFVAALSVANLDLRIVELLPIGLGVATSWTSVAVAVKDVLHRAKCYLQDNRTGS